MSKLIEDLVSHDSPSSKVHGTILIDNFLEEWLDLVCESHSLDSQRLDHFARITILRTLTLIVYVLSLMVPCSCHLCLMIQHAF